MNKTKSKKNRTETVLSVIITTALVLTLAITVANSIKKGNVNDNDNIVDLNETKGALLENETESPTLPEPQTTAPSNENRVAKDHTKATEAPDETEAVKETAPHGQAEDPVDITSEKPTDSVAVDSNDSVKNNLSFNENSALYWPVVGDVILPYNMENTIWFPTLGIYKCNPEIYIACDEGTKINSSCAGVVKSISEDEVNGTSITLSVGNDYTVTYGSVDNLKVAKGDLVKTGDTIGYVAKPTIYFSEEGPGLHFAISCDDEPVDPMMFLE